MTDPPIKTKTELPYACCGGENNVHKADCVLHRHLTIRERHQNLIAANERLTELEEINDRRLEALQNECPHANSLELDCYPKDWNLKDRQCLDCGRRWPEERESK